MDNFDLPTALLKYRNREAISQEEMGKKLCMSRSAYARMEEGKVKPSYERTIEIMAILNMEENTGDEPVSAAPQKWYKSKKLRWVIPIAISVFFISLLMESVGFREGYGEDQFESNPPYETFAVMTAIFCAIYWYYYPPEWPFKKREKII